MNWTNAACPLCHQLAWIVSRSPHWTLALNLNQSLLGRCVLVLNRHAEDVRGVTAEEWTELKSEIGRVTTSIDVLFGPEQYDFAFLMNQDAHVHLHVVPRYSGPREWQGQQWTDPYFGGLFGTEQRHLTDSVMAAMREVIQASLP